VRVSFRDMRQFIVTVKPISVYAWGVLFSCFTGRRRSEAVVSFIRIIVVLEFCLAPVVDC
jgi:hypothetical protein